MKKNAAQSKNNTVLASASLMASPLAASAAAAALVRNVGRKPTAKTFAQQLEERAASGEKAPKPAGKKRRAHSPDSAPARKRPKDSKPGGAVSSRIARGAKAAAIEKMKTDALQATHDSDGSDSDSDSEGGEKRSPRKAGSAAEGKRKGRPKGRRRTDGLEEEWKLPEETASESESDSEEKDHAPAAGSVLQPLRLMGEQNREALLAPLPEKHALEKVAIFQKHKFNFRAWFTELHAGFNLLFFGLGSKKLLLHDFAREWLTDAPVLVVNGYFPALSIKTLLKTISEQILGHSGSFRDPLEHVAAIRRLLSENAQSGGTDSDSDDNVKQMYLLINNIDGPRLRNEHAQTLLSQLAEIPGVHLIASIDHILAPLMWDSRLLNRFNWAAHNVTTFAHYTAETAFAGSDFVGGGRHSGGDHIPIVLQSLTPRHREILKLLAEKQLDEEEEFGERGLEYQQFLSECQELQLTINDTGFRRYLNELCEHRLLKLDRHEGQDFYTVPLPEEHIRKHILAEQPQQRAPAAARNAPSSASPAASPSAAARRSHDSPRKPPARARSAAKPSVSAGAGSGSPSQSDADSAADPPSAAETENESASPLKSTLRSKRREVSARAKPG